MIGWNAVICLATDAEKLSFYQDYMDNLGENSTKPWKLRGFYLMLIAYAFWVIVGLIIEVGFRINYHEKGWPKMYKSHPDLGWVNRAGWHGIYQHRPVQINNHGLRDQEDVAPKRGNERRILLLGDSITFGYDIDFKETYGEQLEGMLNNHEKQKFVYRVLNAGVLGYNTEQEARFLK